MNIEEKAKAYDEALGWMREMYPCLTDSLREDAEHYFPELAESEDERIRKELKEAFEAYDIESTWNGIPIRSILAWLEKQKESLHFPETCEENANSFTDGIIEVRSFQRGMEEGRRLEKQKEQKQAQTSDEKEYIRTIKSIISDFIRDKKPENLAYYQRIYDWLDRRHVPFSCGHENGQPAEWSEEDENALKYIHELLVFGYTEKFMDAQTAHDMRKWVNEHLRTDTFQNGNSHWKPSEQEKGALRTAIHVLTEERNFPKAAAQLQNILDAFEGKESRKDWKPSEEQKEALEYVIRDYREDSCNATANYLQEILDHLKNM